MIVLAIETSTLQGSIALTSGDTLLASATHSEPNAHAEALMALIESVLSAGGCAKADLERIAVGIGPGSFTGLRVGIALAQGIALGLGAPLVGIGSLEALARAGRDHCQGETLRVPVLDARRGEVFIAVMAPNGDWLHPPKAVPSQELAACLDELVGGQSYLALGAAARGLLPESRLCDSGRCAFPHAADVAWLGTTAPTDAFVVPHYVRGADAIKPALAPNPLDS